APVRARLRRGPRGQLLARFDGDHEAAGVAALDGSARRRGARGGAAHARELRAPRLPGGGHVVHGEASAAIPPDRKLTGGCRRSRRARAPSPRGTSESPVAPALPPRGGASP